ncbi:hypothetical protein DFH06DRAFT_1476534 [Mycena polygramma]|nr:hypothetical protein DFH06DRAFT_1476534 [Mycena polygramma]
MTRRSGRLPTPRSVPQYAGNGFINPIRPSAFFSGPPSFVTPPRMPHIAARGVNLNTPSALAWQRHLTTHFVPPTPGNTAAWPEATIPVEEGVVAVPADTLHWTPGTFPPKPFGTPVPLHVHPSLIPNPLNPTIPQLQWDILHFSEQARLYTGAGIIKKPNLKDTAVCPSAEKIWICADDVNCPFLAYWMERWGPIVVENSKGVKIADILDKIQAYFKIPLSRQELHLIRDSSSPLNPAPYAPLRWAAMQRAADQYELFEFSVKSFRRSDVLGAYRQWGGVRPVIFYDQTWKLLLNLLPYPVPRVA